MGVEKEIIIEIERVRVVCQRTKRYDAWCAGCAAKSEFSTPPEAAALSGQSLDWIAELISIRRDSLFRHARQNLSGMS